MSNHRYSPEFKDEAVRQIIEAGHSVPQELYFPTVSLTGELTNVERLLELGLALLCPNFTGGNSTACWIYSYHLQGACMQSWTFS